MNVIQETRKKTINRILITIKGFSKDGLDVLENTFLANLSLETGISRRTLKEYVNTLIHAGKIKREGDLLTANE